MALEFSALGHRVSGCGRDLNELRLLETFLPNPNRRDQADVADDQAVREWASEVIQSSGPPDILINNAAVIHRNAPLWTLSGEEFDQVIDINIKGVANVIRHFVPSMIQRNRGVVVNFSSGWGRSTSAEVAPYCATKWAIEGLTQALAQELPRGVVAVPLNPGIINTDMLKSCFGAGADSYPLPHEWAKRAVSRILGIKTTDNGRPLSV